MAQAAASLSIDTYAGLIITGAVDTIYQVEYTTDPAQSEGWQTAGVLKLPGNPHRWFDVTSSSAEKRSYRAIAVTNIQPATNMVWIEPGTFIMGSPEAEAERQPNETQHEVTLTRGFWMGKYEVTQAEYVDVIGSNPSFFRNGTSGPFGGTGGVVTNELSHPVDRVSWFDATNYCGVMTQRERDGDRLRAGWVYRLPTEAEWEHACRAGTTSASHHGSTLRSGMANFDGRFEYDASVGTIENPEGIHLGRTREVGGYEPNAWGLYDMYGNVAEWCRDLWFHWYAEGLAIDPQGAELSSASALRGGRYLNFPRECRSASRASNRSEWMGHNVGFRVVLAPAMP
jgi:formylglycine-generating enzyme required for sulfatase activity